MSGLRSARRMDGRTAGLLRRGILSSMGNDGYLTKGHRFLSVCDLRQFDAHGGRAV
ncbi:conserved hypothetical protein [Burkholderia cenocepacia]|nr:conserved hypothetical protein [Burkholderia cenocepacia]